VHEHGSLLARPWEQRALQRPAPPPRQQAEGAKGTGGCREGPAAPRGAGPAGGESPTGPPAPARGAAEGPARVTRSRFPFPLAHPRGELCPVPGSVPCASPGVGLSDRSACCPSPGASDPLGTSQLLFLWTSAAIPQGRTCVRPTASPLCSRNAPLASGAAPASLAQSCQLSRQHRALLRCQESRSNPAGFPPSCGPGSFQAPGPRKFHPGLAPISLERWESGSAFLRCVLAARGEAAGPGRGWFHTPTIPDAPCLLRAGFMALLALDQAAEKRPGW